MRWEESSPHGKHCGKIVTLQSHAKKAHTPFCRHEIACRSTLRPAGSSRAPPSFLGESRPTLCSLLDRLTERQSPASRRRSARRSFEPCGPLPHAPYAQRLYPTSNNNSVMTRVQPLPTIYGAPRYRSKHGVRPAPTVPRSSLRTLHFTRKANEFSPTHIQHRNVLM